VGNALTLWEPWTPRAEPRPPPRLFVDRSYVTLCWPALTASAFSVRSRTRPQRKTAVAGRFKEVSLLPIRVTSLRCLSKPCTIGHPFRGGVAFRRRRQRWGSVHIHAIEGTAGFRRAAWLTQVAVHGACGIRFSSMRSPAVSNGRK